MKKGIITIIVLIIILVIIGLLINKKVEAPVEEQGVAVGELNPNDDEMNVPPRNDMVTSTQENSTSVTQDYEAINISTKNKTIVTYTDSGFNPSTILISKGGVVSFVNKSSSAFWPASNNHPSHLLYPEFDSKRSIPSGESYDFTFEKVGSWGFHDHLKSSMTGTITVQ